MSDTEEAFFRDSSEAQKEGKQGIARRQRARLAEQIAYVREHSPYYRELYRDLPPHVEDVRLLPITNIEKLMDRYDDWVTDREVTLERVRAHVNDLSLVGKRLLGKYTVTTTSGTTGRRSFFIMSDHTREMAFNVSTRSLATVFTPDTVEKVRARAWRTAMLVPTGGHFGTHVLSVQQRAEFPHVDQRIFAVTTPIPDLVEQLNAFDPAYVECYPTVALLLAIEQEAGRLRIKPEVFRLGGEGLTDAEYARIRTAFGAKLADTYGANEFPGLMVKCPHGWYHTHDDWMIFEPVNADYQPTPPGERSHSVLLSVLFRRDQPIMRYNMGDSLVVRPDPCECGSPFTAVRVHGRVPILLNFPQPEGGNTTLTSLLFILQVELVPAVERYQIIQTAPIALRVRLQLRPGNDPDRTWSAVHEKLSRMLKENGLAHVTVERGTEPPELSPGGKMRSVIPLS